MTSRLAMRYAIGWLISCATTGSERTDRGHAVVEEKLRLPALGDLKRCSQIADDLADGR